MCEAAVGQPGEERQREGNTEEQGDLGQLAIEPGS